MLTLGQKHLLEEKIYREIKRELNEKVDKSKLSTMRKSVMKWLKSRQQLHSVLAYTLYNKQNADEDEKATVRSLFSKKFRGKDANGNNYYFSDDEIVKLFNMKDRFIDKIE
jgi:hypothetical protein